MRQTMRLLVTALFAALLVACGGETRTQALAGVAQPQIQSDVVQLAPPLLSATMQPAASQGLKGFAAPQAGLVGQAAKAP